MFFKLITSKLIVFIFIPLVLLAAMAVFFKDSFYAINSPLPDRTEGVVFYDKIRAQKNYYNLVNRTMSECEVMGMGGETLFSFPNSACHIFSDGAIFFSQLPEGPTFFDNKGQISWVYKTKSTDHHDLDISEDEQEIFILMQNFHKEKNQDIKTHQILGFTKSGKTIFDWHEEDHVDEIFSAARREKTMNPEDKPLSYLHLNSLQVLPRNSLEKEHPAFRHGNILVNCFRNKLVFIIDRRTSQIVWSHSFQKDHIHGGENFSFESGAHTVKFLKNNNLLLFLNKATSPKHPEAFSAIIEMNPISHQTVWWYTSQSSSAFYSDVWASVYKLSNDNVLVTDSLVGRAFEVTPDKRIVWQWTDPQKKPDGSPIPVYRLTRVPRQRVDEVIKIWQAVK